MRQVLLALLLLCLPLSAEAQTVLWFAGAETGDLREWGPQSGTGTCVAGNSGAHAGVYLLACAPSTVVIQTPTNLAFAATTLYARFYFKWVSPFGGNQIVIQFNNAAVTKNVFVGLRQSDRILYWGHNSGGVIAAGSTALTENVYYRVEIKAVISATVGGIELKLNGSTEFSSLATDTSDVSAIDRCYFGPGFAGASINEHFDDAMICSGAYCPPGVSIARQGAAGTPTYDTWTKTSCTGSVIDGCWSDTPFSATSNANSATATNAQTMLVSTFLTTQTGHGSETVGPSSTINACKTAMIAKGASGTPSIKIRRRLSGSDTDTTKTMTTSDAYYDDGIWTTTASVLRGSTMEIGVVQNQTTVTETVEDMWMICDYLDGTALQRKVIQD